MSPPGATLPNAELEELARRFADVTIGGGEALRDIRPALHRVVVSPDLSGAVKTLVVQALLLLDDPRLLESGANQSGAILLLKIRKLLEAAAAAHACGGAPTPAAGVPLSSASFSPDALLSPNTDPALVEEFVTEAREQLAVAEGSLLILDTDPDDAQALDAMFRALHTLKGTSAFLGVEHATELAHHAESLLARVRSGAARCEGELSNLLFRAIDMLDAMLVAIESVSDGEPAMLPDGFRPLLDALRAEPSDDRPPLATPRVSGAIRRLRVTESTLRIRTADLERLAEVARQLELTHAMLARDGVVRAASADLSRKFAHADGLIAELRSVVTELRTIRFGVVLQRLARIARDAAKRSGKTVSLDLHGEDVLIERAIAEALSDSLAHMVRNAIDHGFEEGEARVRAGKAEAGRLRISAGREGAELVIVVADDGRGLDARRLMRHAVERGILAPGFEMTDQEAFSLILRPGFTTAARVTELSGRGVGMDVVRSHVEAAGGTIDIDSRVGLGTTFTIRLPFRSQPQRDVETWGELPRTIGLIA